MTDKFSVGFSARSSIRRLLSMACIAAAGAPSLASAHERPNAVHQLSGRFAVVLEGGPHFEEAQRRYPNRLRRVRAVAHAVRLNNIVVSLPVVPR